MIKVKVEHLNTERYLNMLNINFFSMQMENRTIFKMTSGEVIITSDSIKDIFEKNQFIEKHFIQTKIKETNLQSFINIKNISHITPNTNDSLSLCMVNGEQIMVLSEINKFIRDLKSGHMKI